MEVGGAGDAASMAVGLAKNKGKVGKGPGVEAQWGGLLFVGGRSVCGHSKVDTKAVADPSLPSGDSKKSLGKEIPGVPMDLHNRGGAGVREMENRVIVGLNGITQRIRETWLISGGPFRRKFDNHAILFLSLQMRQQMRDRKSVV